MANPEIHRAKSEGAAKSFGLRVYPASVRELSALIAGARRDSDVAAPSTIRSGGPFKKSLTCGSLFVRCACDGDGTAVSPPKRSSNPCAASAGWTAATGPNDKRLSDPEVGRERAVAGDGPGHHRLGRPEVRFPLAEAAKGRKGPEADCPEVRCRRSDLEYHR